jgi:membrane protease YdiL (CAAX protease family)
MIDKKGVFWFLGLTFGLTWLLDLAIYLLGDYGTPGVIAIVQLSGLMPAFSAILLGLFFFPDSPIYFRRSAGRGRWFYYFYLLFTVLFALGTLLAWLAPAQGTISIVTANAPLLLSVLGLFLLVVLRIVAGREAMARVWLAWGHWRYWLVFTLGIVVFSVLQVGLNAIFGLGPTNLSLAIAIQGSSPAITVIVFAVNMVLLMSILGIVIGFGEEYGWRGYLQNKLFKLGRVRGVLLLGVIWGIWHWPVILMGHNYPDRPLLGLVLMVLYTTGFGIVLGYAVLKSGSVLLVSFLHAITNQLANFLFVQLGFTPYDSAVSFGLGIYGLTMLAIIALLILRDPIWRGKGGNLPLPSPAPVDTVVLNKGQTLTPSPGVD